MLRAFSFQAWEVLSDPSKLAQRVVVAFRGLRSSVQSTFAGAGCFGCMDPHYYHREADTASRAYNDRDVPPYTDSPY